MAKIGNKSMLLKRGTRHTAKISQSWSGADGGRCVRTSLFLSRQNWEPQLLG